MRVHFLILVLGTGAFVITDRLHSTFESIKKSTSEPVSSVKHHVQDISDLLLERASQLEDAAEEFLEIDGAQHTFELFEEDHSLKHGKHSKKPQHPPQHGNPHDQKDKSIYEFIAESEYFSTLHSIIVGDEHAVQELNKTTANLTLFAPTNKALEKYEHHPPPVEYLRKILLYHLLPDVFPAGRVLKSKTLETIYFEEEINTYQRLAVDINFRGLTLNYYARIIYIDIFTNNGVVHAIDNLLFPPPPIYVEAELLPTTFSTFINAAWETGLVESLNETSHSTIFAPTNFAFAKLGARLNAYLFSSRGQTVLTKILKYHIVPDVLFYSDAVFYYTPEQKALGLVEHYEFENLLGKKINVDVGAYGRFKTIVFNGRRIQVSDTPAKNGVLSALDSLIMPYKDDLKMNVQDMSIEQFESLFEDDSIAPETTVSTDRKSRTGGCHGRSRKSELSVEQLKQQMMESLWLQEADLSDDQIYTLF